jgi:mannose-6-phosphate isomerase-like protein (cupin superfamily)
MRKNVLQLLAVAGALTLTADGIAQKSSSEAYQGDLDRLAEQNDEFRKVLYTGSHLQLVLMSLKKGKEIGRESHDVDQCLFIVEGSGRAEVGARTSKVSEDGVVCIPAGMEHNIVNTGRKPMKLFTVYGPPQHAPGTVHHTRAEAQRAEEAEARR